MEIQKRQGVHQKVRVIFSHSSTQPSSPRMMTTRHGKAFLNPNNQCRSVSTKFQPCLTFLSITCYTPWSIFAWILANASSSVLGLSHLPPLFALLPTCLPIHEEVLNERADRLRTRLLSPSKSWVVQPSLGVWEAKYLLRTRQLIQKSLLRILIPHTLSGYIQC